MRAVPPVVEPVPVTALTAAAGPTIVTVLGYDVPVLSALVGIAAVIVARMLARQQASPVKPLPLAYEIALNVLLSLLIVAIVIDDHKAPLIALGFGIGLGYAGITVIQAIAEKFSPQVVAAVGVSAVAADPAAPAPTPPTTAEEA